MKAVTKFAWAGGIVALGLATGATTYSLWSDPAAMTCRHHQRGQPEAG